jgi:diacylglycerol O-acyltransferase / wax synthase
MSLLVPRTIVVLFIAIGFSYYYQTQGKPPFLAIMIVIFSIAFSLGKFFHKSNSAQNKESVVTNASRDVHGPKKSRMLWSFTSQTLAQGSFPTKVQFKEPIINAVLFFSRGRSSFPSKSEIVDQVVNVLLEYERFNSVFDPVTSRAIPCDDDLDAHDLVREVEFSGSSDGDIMKLMEQQANHPLSEGLRGAVLPWWEFLILNNTNENGSSAVVWRVHHALGDGMSLVQVVQEIFLSTQGEKLVDVIPAGMKKKFQTKRSPFDWMIDFVKGILTVLTIPIGPFDDMTVFSKTSTSKKTMIFPKRHEIHSFEPVPLEFVKELKTAAGDGVTVNDILFTCLSQAIHDYLKEEDDPLLKSKGDALLGRALLPVAMPRPKTLEKARTLRNLWCFVSCDLSVGVDSISDRLQCIHQTLSELKTSLIPAITMGLQTYVLKYFPTSFNRDQVLKIFARHSLVFSNVPGPLEPVMFAGHKVQSVQMIHLNLLPQLGLLSYRGTIFGNICLGIHDEEDGSKDNPNMPHRERLPLHFSNAFILMAKQFGVTTIPQSLQEDAARLKGT